MINRYFRLGFLLAACVGAAGLANAAKSPHIENEVTGPEIFIRPEFQDLGTNNMVISKRVFGDDSEFNGPDTTITLDLIQAYGPTVAGTAKFQSANLDTTSILTIPVVGKTKSKKQKIGSEKVLVPGFTLKGSILQNGSSVTLSIAAQQNGFVPAATQTATALSTATYNVAVDIRGLPVKYSYNEVTTATGHFHFGYELAPDSASPLGIPNTKSDFYYIYAPFQRGIALGTGTFRIKNGDGILSIKGPKLKLTATDEEYQGPGTFDSDFIKLKTAANKFTGDPDQF